MLPEVCAVKPWRGDYKVSVLSALEGGLDGNNDTCKYSESVVFIPLMPMPSIAPSVLTTQLVAFNEEQVIMKMKGEEMEMTLMIMSFSPINTPVQSPSLLRKDSFLRCDMRRDMTCTIKNIYNSPVFIILMLFP